MRRLALALAVIIPLLVPSPLSPSEGPTSVVVPATPAAAVTTATATATAASMVAPDAALPEGWRAAPFKITAYAPFDNQSGICADSTPNTTATGSLPVEGTFAVNFKIIPAYSDIIILYEDGTIEVGRALDTGGALRAPGVYIIDVFRRTHEQAIQHGVRPATVLWRSKD